MKNKILVVICLLAISGSSFAFPPENKDQRPYVHQTTPMPSKKHYSSGYFPMGSDIHDRPPAPLVQNKTPNNTHKGWFRK